MLLIRNLQAWFNFVKLFPGSLKYFTSFEATAKMILYFFKVFWPNDVKTPNVETRENIFDCFSDDEN